MELNERSLSILEAIVEGHIASGEPMGSRTIAKQQKMPLSPATVRNVMSDLEEMGYIVSPHTSAGRICLCRLSIGSSLLRFTGITIVSYFCFYPMVLLLPFAPAIITQSVDFLFLPEKILILLLPLSLLFPLTATIISRIRQRRIQEVQQTTQSPTQ